MEHKFTGETCRTWDAILVCCILRGPDIALRLLVRSFSRTINWLQLKRDICSPIELILFIFATGIFVLYNAKRKETVLGAVFAKKNKS